MARLAGEPDFEAKVHATLQEKAPCWPSDIANALTHGSDWCEVQEVRAALERLKGEGRAQRLADARWGTLPT